MGLLRNLWEDIATELERATRPTYRPYRGFDAPSPNAQVATTPAQHPATPSQSGVVRPFPGGAQFVPITLDGSGNGVAQIGPARVREHWQVASAAVAVSTAVKQAQCSLYVGTSLASSTFLGNTASGSSGDTCGIGQDIQSGQSIFAKWTGGDVGATATLTVFGTYSIGVPQS